MKSFRIFAIAVILVVPLVGRAAPEPMVAARIGQVVSLFRPDPAGYDTLFSAEFISKVGDQLSGIFQKYFKDYGAVTGWSYRDSSKQWGAKARLVFSKGFTVDASIHVDPSGAHLIDGLVLGAASPAMKTLSEISTKIARLRGLAGFLAARLSAKSIGTIAEANADSEFALGSAFKLYVLATLLRDINSGARHWSDVVKLDAASRSHPSGIMQKWPVGTPITLATAATLMISISDNTATDLLIHTLGREYIEETVALTGGDVKRNAPFLTTLEMFKLKSNEGRMGKRYVTLAVGEKRKLLAGEVAAFSRDSVDFGSNAGKPFMIGTLEWFASPEQIAKLYQWIYNKSSSGEGAHVRDILAVNAGLAFDKSWKYIGFKGGSEPGVIDLSYLLENAAGDWFVLTGSWNDPDSSVNESDFEGYIQRAAELLQ